MWKFSPVFRSQLCRPVFPHCSRLGCLPWLGYSAVSRPCLPCYDRGVPHISQSGSCMVSQSNANSKCNRVCQQWIRQFCVLPHVTRKYTWITIHGELVHSSLVVIGQITLCSSLPPYNNGFKWEGAHWSLPCYISMPSFTFTCLRLTLFLVNL